MRTGREARLTASVGLVFVMLSAVSWGTTGVATQALYGFAATTPLSVGFFRLALAVPVLFVAGWLNLGWGMLKVSRRDAVLMVASGLLIATSQVCYFSSIRYLGVAAATLITGCSAPIIVAILSSVVIGERPSPRVLAALACALAGTATLVGFVSLASTRASAIVGGALAAGSALSYALFILCGRSLGRRCHPLQSMAFATCVGAVSLLSAGLLTELVVSYPRVGWALLAYLGLVPTAFGYALFLAGMRRVEATTASIATLLEPLTSTALACFLFKERLGESGWIGFLLLAVALGALPFEGNEARASARSA